MSAGTRRPWLILGIALASMLTIVGAWWGMGSDRGRSSSKRGAISSVPSEPQSEPSAGARRSPLRSRSPGHHLVAGVLVSPELGPLASGRVDLWCMDGRLLERVGVGEDGAFSGPACPTTTCARLVHPAFEQAEPWELDLDRRRDLEVIEVPGIEGVVVSSVGDPIADASLILSGEGGERAATRTDMAGEFAVGLPALRPCDVCDHRRGPPNCLERGSGLHTSHARLLVLAPEFAPIEVVVALGAPSALELILPPPAAPITGVVVGIDGEPFDARAKVLATNLEREAEQHASMADASGRFSLTGLAQGRYRLRAVRDGRELASEVVATPGDEVELRAEIPADGRTLTLEILDGDDRPVPDVRVDGGPFRAATTDHEGHVTAGAVLPGSYTLRLRTEDCPVIRELVEVASDPVGSDRVLRLSLRCDPHGRSGQGR